MAPFLYLKILLIFFKFLVIIAIGYKINLSFLYRYRKFKVWKRISQNYLKFI